MLCIFAADYPFKQYAFVTFQGVGQLSEQEEFDRRKLKRFSAADHIDNHINLIRIPIGFC
jgi:hypothetical protein